MCKLLFMTHVVFLLTLGISGAAVGQQVPPEVTLPGSQFHQFHTKNGTEYDLYIAGPTFLDSADFYPDENTQYPVLYVLDAGGHFLLIAHIYFLMRLRLELPPMLLVGIDKPSGSVREALASRILDLTPTRVPEQEQTYSQRYDQPVRSGGAAAFLSVMREEIIPWVEARYPTSNERGLVGFSLGGLYATHVLLTAPDTFTHYLIGSPSLWWDSEIMFEREHAYSEEFEDLSARVFLSAGTLEPTGMLPNTLRLAETLKSRNYKSLELRSHIFKDETHLSVISPTYSRGLRFLFGEK